MFKKKSIEVLIKTKEYMNVKVKNNVFYFSNVQGMYLEYW